MTGGLRTCAAWEIQSVEVGGKLTVSSSQSKDCILLFQSGPKPDFFVS